MMTTSRIDLYERMLSFRSLCCLTYDPKGKYLPIDETKHPMGKRYWYLDFDEIGFNYRMTDAQAAVGWSSCRSWIGFNARRIEIAKRYCEGLHGHSRPHHALCFAGCRNTSSIFTACWWNPSSA